jgi:hypothetical protein
MTLNEKEKEKILIVLQNFLSDVDFGRLFCNFSVSDDKLMYVDFKREKNERVYFHGKPDNNLEAKNEKDSKIGF